MARTHYLQTNFTAGEITPRAYGRPDVSKYGNAIKSLTNYLIYPQGPISRRSGTRFVEEVKNSSKKIRLKDFEFSTVQAYIIEFGDQYLRFYKDQGIILSGMSPYEISSTYLEADLAGLSFTQSADVLYITHPNYPPRKLTRTGHTSWTLSDIVFKEPPWGSVNRTSTTVTPSGTTGAITLTASASLFNAGHVGRKVRLKSASVSGWCEITGYTSATVVNATVNADYPLPSGAQTDFYFDAFYTGNYPRAVCFYEERLSFAGTTAQPQTIWMSESGNYEAFGTTDKAAKVQDSSGITYTIASNKVNSILWLQSGAVLLVGTFGGEWRVKAGSSSQPLTPTNVQVTQQTSFGSRQNTPTLTVGSAVLFVQRSGRRLREFIYNFEIDGYVARDATILGEHLLRSGDYITDATFQQEPHSVWWGVRADGVLIGLTYLRDQEVLGWHKHIIGGSFNGGNAVVENVAVIPTPDGSEDQLWMCVKRTINGQTKRYIEYMDVDFDPDDANDKDDAFFVDCGATYSGASTTTITGLSHLEGQSVQILGNGAVQGDKTVATGSITLSSAVTKAQVGLQFKSHVTFLSLEAGGNFGTGFGKMKRTHKVGVRLLNSLGLQFKTGENSETDSDWQERSFRGTSDPMDSSPPLFTGNIEPLSLEQSYEREGIFSIRQAQPLPMTILAVTPEMVVYE